MDLAIKITEPTQPHTHTVVFLHGRGDTAYRFSAALEQWHGADGKTLAETFPSFRWVLPQAPRIACASMRGALITQWFDTWSSRNYSLREEVQVPGLKATVSAIQALLADEAAKLASSMEGSEKGWDRLVLAGISMGGAAGIHTLLNLDVPTPGRRLAALLTFSSRCPYVDRQADMLDLGETRALLELPSAPDHADVVRNTPILMQHCIDDSVVPIARGWAARDALQRFGGQVTWKEYNTGGHWLQSPLGCDDTVAFLREHVLGNTQN